MTRTHESNGGAGGAIFDTDESSAVYRYLLWRDLAEHSSVDGRADRVNGTALFIMLNPSTATHLDGDPTIRRCISFARSWGASRLEVVNLFAQRATDPAELLRVSDPVGPDNGAFVEQAALHAGRIICAWGASVPRGSGWQTHVRDVLEIVRDAAGQATYCLGRTKAGHPRHPLYLKASTPLELF